jgi:hypothetical protein
LAERKALLIFKSMIVMTEIDHLHSFLTEALLSFGHHNLSFGLSKRRLPIAEHARVRYDVAW